MTTKLTVNTDAVKKGVKHMFYRKHLKVTGVEHGRNKGHVWRFMNA